MKTLNAPGDLNISRVLRLIWQTKGISRIEIAQQLGIDKSTVTKIVSALQDIGIIRAFAQGSAGPLGGRKPIQLEIVGEFGLSVGIEITTDGFVAAIADLNGAILHEVSQSLEVTSIFEAFDAAVASLKPDIEGRNTPLLGIGVGIPAVVNAEAGTILQSIPLMIEEETGFCAAMTEKYGVPVYLENDARCGCLGEMALRHGKELENALFLLSEIRKITGSTGSRKNLSVGCGFILNGNPYYGREYSAGEFRSILWKPGNSGQFQSNDLSGELVGSDRSVTGSVFSELAAHVALMANLLNLDSVFLGGLTPELTEELALMIREEINLKWPYRKHQRCEVIPSSLGKTAVAYGAAGYCILRFFSLPNIYQPSGSGPSLKQTLEGIRS